MFRASLISAVAFTVGLAASFTPAAASVTFIELGADAKGYSVVNNNPASHGNTSNTEAKPISTTDLSTALATGVSSSVDAKSVQGSGRTQALADSDQLVAASLNGSPTDVLFNFSGHQCVDGRWCRGHGVRDGLRQRIDLFLHFRLDGSSTTASLQWNTFALAPGNPSTAYTVDFYDVTTNTHLPVIDVPANAPPDTYFTDRLRREFGR